MAPPMQVPFNGVEFFNSYPLHFACKVGDSQTAKTILQSNVNLALAEDKFCGWTPAHWAAYFGNLDCLRILMSIMPNVNIQTSKHSLTPAHCAAESGNAEVLAWLLQAGANPNLKDFAGETPLHKSARSGSSKCIGLLLAASSDVRITNNDGELPSVVAEKNGHHSVASCLHHAEIVHVLGGNNGFSGSIARSNSIFPVNRKRSLDCNNNEISKRIRTGGDAPENAGLQFGSVLSYPPVTTSVVEHDRLCSMEQLYTNATVDSIIAMFHGC